MHDQEELSDIESDNLLGYSVNSLRKRSWITRVTPYNFAISISLNFLLIVLGFIFWVCNKYPTQRSYEHGFASDLGSMKSEVELTQYHFTGGVKLTEDGAFFTDHTSMNQEHVGHPNPEIDLAWSNLLSGLNIDLDDAEANDLTGRTFQWPESGLYFTGLEVFHSLHCLNRIRQALYPEYYNVFSNPNDPSRDAHIGHCINHIRQAIQCHADLTPMEWIQVGDKVILKTNTLHTCRNFEMIHDWAKKRRTQFDKIESVKNGSLFIVD